MSSNTDNSISTAILVILILLFLGALAIAWYRFKITTKVKRAFRAQKRKFANIATDDVSIWSDGSHTLINGVDGHKDLEKAQYVKAGVVTFEMVPTPAASKSPRSRSPSSRSTSTIEIVTFDDVDPYGTSKVSRPASVVTIDSLHVDERPNSAWGEYVVDMCDLDKFRSSRVRKSRLSEGFEACDVSARS